MAKIKINWEVSGEYTIDLEDSEITLEEWGEFTKSEQDGMIQIYLNDELAGMMTPQLQKWEIIQ